MESIKNRLARLTAQMRAETGGWWTVVYPDGHSETAPRDEVIRRVLRAGPGEIVEVTGDPEGSGQLLEILNYVNGKMKWEV